MSNNYLHCMDWASPPIYCNICCNIIFYDSDPLCKENETYEVASDNKSASFLTGTGASCRHRTLSKTLKHVDLVPGFQM